MISCFKYGDGVCEMYLHVSCISKLPRLSSGVEKASLWAENMVQAWLRSPASGCGQITRPLCNSSTMTAIMQ